MKYLSKVSEISSHSSTLRRRPASISLLDQGEPYDSGLFSDPIPDERQFISDHISTPRPQREVSLAGAHTPLDFGEHRTPPILMHMQGIFRLLARKLPRMK